MIPLTFATNLKLTTFLVVQLTLLSWLITTSHLPNLPTPALLLLTHSHIGWLIYCHGLHLGPSALLKISPLSRTHVIYDWPRGSSVGRYPVIQPIIGRLWAIHACPRVTKGHTHYLIWISRTTEKNWRQWLAYSRSQILIQPNETLTNRSIFRRLFGIIS